MSANIEQIFVANPITSNASTDLMYFGQSPYGAGNDAAMTYANFKAQFGAPYTAAALTETNDTNVTLTLGGTPTTALLQAVSITAGWTGTLSGTRGGTGANNGASTLTYGGNTAFSGAFTFTGTLTNNTAVTFPTSGTLATTSQIPAGAALTEGNDTNVTLTLGGSASTALVNPASITAGWTGTLSGTRGGTGVNNGASTITLGGNLTTSGAFASTFTMTNTTSVTFPTSGTLATTAQLPVTITTASIAGTTQAAAVNTRYIVANAGQTTITLPTTFAIGDTVIIKGLGAGGWILAAGTATTIRMGSSQTSSAGSLTSVNQYDTVSVSGLVANTTWSVDYSLSAGLTVA